MRDTIVFRYDLHSMTREEFLVALDRYRHLNVPSESNAICVLEGKDECKFLSPNSAISNIEPFTPSNYSLHPISYGH